MIPDRHGQTDNRIDRRLTAASPRSALASRGNNVGNVTTTHHSGFLLAPIRTTWNELECPIHLKVRFTDGMLDVRMFWLPELACVTG